MMTAMFCLNDRICSSFLSLNTAVLQTLEQKTPRPQGKHAATVDVNQCCCQGISIDFDFSLQKPYSVFVDIWICRWIFPLLKCGARFGTITHINTIHHGPPLCSNLNSYRIDRYEIVYKYGPQRMNPTNFGDPLIFRPCGLKVVAMIKMYQQP